MSISGFFQSMLEQSVQKHDKYVFLKVELGLGLKKLYKHLFGRKLYVCHPSKLIASKYCLDKARVIKYVHNHQLFVFSMQNPMMLSFVRIF